MTVVVVGKVMPTARKAFEEPVVHVRARAVPLSKKRKMILRLSVGVPESALIVRAFACAVAAYMSKLSLFHASGLAMVAVELTLGVMVLLVSV